MKTVFPQAYLFPARNHQNVMLVTTLARFPADIYTLRQRAAVLVQTWRVTVPAFRERLERFQAQPPASAARSPVLSDDYAPVEGLAGRGGF